MLPKILSVDRNRPVITEVILGIPEFVNLLETTQGDLLPFMYLWAMYDPESPYMNISEIEREEKVLSDYPVHRYLDEPEMIQAIKKCEELYFSPVRKILKASKKAIENISDFLEDNTITDGRDGNLTQVVNTIKSLPQILKAYQDAETAYKKELQRNRGAVKSAVDEDYEPSYD